jgi:hypothetical protein
MRQVIQAFALGYPMTATRVGPRGEPDPFVNDDPTGGVSELVFADLCVSTAFEEHDDSQA